MQSYVTPEELAQQLKIEVEDVMSLIEQGQLRAIRVGQSIRIPEAEVEKMHVTCAVVPTAESAQPVSRNPETEALPIGSRWCRTLTGRAKFKVSGSIASGADIWPGQMRYPIKFPKHFMDAMLAHFRSGEFRIGGKFDDPGPESLGEFIQNQLKIKMNPAVYLAALLVDEGYADTTRRGCIRLRR